MKKYRGVFYERNGERWFVQMGAFKEYFSSEEDMHAAIDQLLDIVHGLEVDEKYEEAIKGEVK